MTMLDQYIAKLEALDTRVTAQQVLIADLTRRIADLERAPAPVLLPGAPAPSWPVVAPVPGYQVWCTSDSSTSYPVSTGAAAEGPAPAYAQTSQTQG